MKEGGVTVKKNENGLFCIRTKCRQGIRNPLQIVGSLMQCF